MVRRAMRVVVAGAVSLAVLSLPGCAQDDQELADLGPGGTSGWCAGERLASRVPWSGLSSVASIPAERSPGRRSSWRWPGLRTSVGAAVADPTCPGRSRIISDQKF